MMNKIVAILANVLCLPGLGQLVTGHVGTGLVFVFFSLLNLALVVVLGPFAAFLQLGIWCSALLHALLFVD